MRQLTRIQHLHPAAVLFLAALVFVCGSGRVQGATLVDQDGNSIEVSQPFRRIISLYPGHTENLFSLGLDAEIIGVAKDDDYPAAARGRKAYNAKEDAEKILAASPDLVLVRPMLSRAYPDLLGKLRQAGIVVVSLQPTTMEETYTYWRQLGLLTGRSGEAEKMAGEFQERLARFRATVARIPPAELKNVYFESIHSKMKTFAPNSMAVMVLTAAGGRNVASDAEAARNTNIAEYGKERILSHGEGIDLFLAQRGTMNQVSREEIVNEPGFQAIKAVREGKIAIVDEQLVSRPTMRLLTGIAEVGRILYPAYFEKL